MPRQMSSSPCSNLVNPHHSASTDKWSSHFMAASSQKSESTKSVQQLEKELKRRQIWKQSKKEVQNQKNSLRGGALHENASFHPRDQSFQQIKGINRQILEEWSSSINQLPINQLPIPRPVPKVKKSPTSWISVRQSTHAAYRLYTVIARISIGAYKLLATLGPAVGWLCMFFVPLLISYYVIVGIGLTILNMIICPSLSLLCLFPFAAMTPVCPASFCFDQRAPMNNITISETIKSANENLTRALYEGHPLMSMSKVLMDTDNALHEARWLVESSDIPSRFDLVQALEQYDENSDTTQEDLSAFTAKTGSTIDHLLQHIDWAVQSLTTIDAEFSQPNPDLSRFPQLQAPRGFGLIHYTRAMLIPSIRSRLPFSILWTPPSHAAMARFLVMQEFTLYIHEITPYLGELTLMASKLFASLQVLKTDLETIRTITSHDQRTTHILRHAIESKRTHFTRLQLLFGLPAHDTSSLTAQLASLHHVTSTVRHGMKNVHAILRALHHIKADLKNLHLETARFGVFRWRAAATASDPGSWRATDPKTWRKSWRRAATATDEPRNWERSEASEGIRRQANVLRECAQGLKVGKEDWKRQRWIVNRGVLEGGSEEGGEREK